MPVATNVAMVVYIVAMAINAGIYVGYNLVSRGVALVVLALAGQVAVFYAPPAVSVAIAVVAVAAWYPILLHIKSVRQRKQREYEQRLAESF